jgi:hypothetical protein
MPTTRPRHVITETDDIARALDDAARRWPDDSDSRSKLLLHLLDEGHRAVIEQSTNNAEAQRHAIAHTDGALTGMYGDNYLDQLRDDWLA